MHRPTVVLLVLTAALLVAADARDDAVKKEKENLKGTWKVMSLQVEGRENKQEGMALTFAEDKLTIQFKDDKKTANYTLDPTAKPRTIDLVPDEGAEKGKTIKGIYVLDGDDLKICAAAKSDKERPTEFATKEGSGSVLLVLKREK